MICSKNKDLRIRLQSGVEQDDVSETEVLTEDVAELQMDATEGEGKMAGVTEMTQPEVVMPTVTEMGAVEADETSAPAEAHEELELQPAGPRAIPAAWNHDMCWVSCIP